MAKVHYCRLRINLAGQNCHIVVFDEHNPLTWPEVQVLMQLHGEDNVMDVMPIRIGDVIPTHEKDRLISQYGYRVVESVFPGRQFRMGLMMTGDEQLPHVDGRDAPDPGNGLPAEDEVAVRLAASQAVFKPARNVRPRPDARE